MRNNQNSKNKQYSKNVGKIWKEDKQVAIKYTKESSASSDTREATSESLMSDNTFLQGWLWPGTLRAGDPSGVEIPGCREQGKGEAAGTSQVERSPQCQVTTFEKETLASPYSRECFWQRLWAVTWQTRSSERQQWEKSMVHQPNKFSLHQQCDRHLEDFSSAIARRNINNLRHADDTTLVAEREEELKSLLMKVKEERGKAGLKLNSQKMKIMVSGPITW